MTIRSIHGPRGRGSREKENEIRFSLSNPMAARSCAWISTDLVLGSLGPRLARFGTGLSTSPAPNALLRPRHVLHLHQAIPYIPTRLLLPNALAPCTFAAIYSMLAMTDNTVVYCVRCLACQFAPSPQVHPGPPRPPGTQDCPAARSGGDVTLAC